MTIGFLEIFMLIFVFLVIGRIFLIGLDGLDWPKKTVRIPNSSDLNEPSLTIKELKSKMNELADEYCNQSVKLTSVQLANFETKLEKKYNIKISSSPDSGYYYIEHKLVIIDDIFEVNDVHEMHGYQERRFRECYHVSCSNDGVNFQFSALQNSGADKLNKGEKIHIRGTVYISPRFEKRSPEIRSISMRETDYFKIKFNIV